MIKLMSIIKEIKKFPYGCIMAYIGGDDKDKILSFNKKLIDDDIIYNNKQKEFGREIEPHVTIKFGLTKAYTRDEIGNMLDNIIPFKIKLKKISVFENDDFDVVKLDADGEELRQLNKKFSKLPNEDEHPEYHPHCTLAYVNPGEGKKFEDKGNEISNIIINKIVYSRDGEKYHYELKEKK